MTAAGGATPRRAAAAVSQRQSQAASLTVLTLAAAVLPLFALTAEGELPADLRAKGAILWVLCFAPALRYATRSPRRRRPVPIFAIVSVVFAVYYALPALLGTVNLAYNPNQIRIPLLDPKTQFADAVNLALWGWIMVLVGYGVLPLLFRRRPRPENPWPVALLAPWLTLMIVGGLLSETGRAVISLPTWIGGLVAFFTTLSRFAMGMMLTLRARGHLRPRENLALLIGIPLEIVLLVSTGSIAAVFLFVLFLLLSQHIGGGQLRLRWVVVGLAVAVPLVAVKGVLGEYRRQAWFTDVQLGVSGRTALMGSLLSDEVDARGVVPTIEHGWTAVVTRSATLDLFADIVQRTPHDIPYWGGQTYLSLVGLAVPRFLWPSKPTKSLGQDFGHRYQFLDARDSYTSINFPFLVEFYANFGAIGVIAGMFITGVLYGVLDQLLNVPGQSIIRSLAGLSIMLPLLNIESDFSLVFGGLFLNAVAFLFVLQFLRRRIERDAAISRRSPRRLVLGSPTSRPAA